MTTWVDCDVTKSARKSKRNELTLKKTEVIEHVKKNPGLGFRNVAEVFECGKMQIQSIFLHRDTIFAKYEGGGWSSERKWHHTAEYREVNDAVYKWYCHARQWCIPVSVPLLQEEALQIAKKIDLNTNFKWVVNSFKKCYNIKIMTISGECADVLEETITGWHERMKVLMDGYQAQDVWNSDKTGVFLSNTSEKTLADMKNECQGDKMAKERLTILFFADAGGGKEPPIIIGNEHPIGASKACETKQLHMYYHTSQILRHV